MEHLLTIQNLTFAAGIIGILFTVYKYFRDPQDTLDKRQAVSEKEVDGKASLLAQQVQWEKESTDKRFAEFSSRIDGALTLAQNHIHTVDMKCDKTIESVNMLTVQIAKLSTIIEERMPKHK